MRKKLSFLFFIFLGIIFLFPYITKAQSQISGNIFIYPHFTSLENPFGVFIKIKGLDENKDYQYGLWVYGGTKGISRIWTGGNFASSYTYIDIPKEKIDKDGNFESWVILKIIDLPSSNYNYYLRFRVREKGTTKIVAENTKYHKEDNFHLFSQNYSELGFVSGWAFSEDGDALEGGMATVRGENLEYFSISPCAQNGFFYLPLLFGEDYFLQITDTFSEPITKAIPFSLKEKELNLQEIFFSDPLPVLELSDFQLEEIEAQSLKLTWKEIEGFLFMEIYISQDFFKEGMFWGRVKNNFVKIENLLPNEKYYFTLKVYNKDFLFSVFKIEATTLLKTYSSGVFINELCPSLREGEEEFIEIYNSNNFEVDLSSWVLKDGMGAVREFVIPAGTKIAPFGFLVFQKKETKIILNDDEDFVLLFSPDGFEKDKSPPYKKALSGFSFSFFTTGWRWTKMPTPGKVNQLVIVEDKISKKKYLSLSIKEAKKKPKGTLVVIEGVVTTPPKVLGSQIFYIQDKSGGIQIYFSKADFPSLSLGKQVRIYGELSEYFSEKRIKVSKKEDIIVLTQGNLPSYISIKTGANLLNYVGMLVKISGKVTETSGATFYISDGTGPLKVYVKPSTTIKKPKMRKGDLVTVWGILSQSKSGFRLLPVFQKDIVIGKSKEDSEKEKNSLFLPTVKAATSDPSLIDLFSQDKSKKSSLNWTEILGWILMGGGFLGLILIKAKKYRFKIGEN